MKVETKSDLLALLRENRHQIRALGVERLGLFGSFSREEQSATSDVDLLVEFASGQKSFDNFIHLAFLLEDLLERKVELATPESLSPYIGPRILASIEYAPINA
ncbi:MAG: nucleotidyltransferase family protein [Chloroflexi bacterium]|nr:nucleotidyltransferase family protein [Chloroflexota bacterium]